MPRQRVLCITTGGSIDKTYSGEASEFVVGAPAAKAVIRGSKCQHTVKFTEICRKDSLELTEEDREAIVAAVKGARETLVVITHGTDTMWKTALAVRSAAEEAGKVVAVTGAMRPAAFKDSDAAFNLGAAFAVVQYLPAGVHVVMNGVVFSDPEKLEKDAKAEVFVEKQPNGDKPADDDPAETTTLDPANDKPGYRGRGRGRSRGRGRGRGRDQQQNRGRRRAEAPVQPENDDHDE